MAADLRNPYAPPGEPLGRQRRTSTFAASMLVLALFLVAVLRAFRGAVYVAVLMPWDLAREAAVVLTPDTLGLSWVVTRPFFALCVATFTFWVYRANADVWRQGVPELTFTPGWAAAIGFVPVANLVGPYRVVKELYQASGASARRGGWESSRTPSLLGLWWLTWMTSVVWSLVPYGALTSTSVFWGQAVFELLRAASALLLIVVVKRIEHRLTALADTGSASGWVAARAVPSGGRG